MIAKKLREKTAQEWEDYFQSKHVPATRVRELKETLQDPHLKHRGVLHRHENVPGVPSSGALMSAKAATREKGELLVEEWVRGIADAVKQEFKFTARPPGAARRERAMHVR